MPLPLRSLLLSALLGTALVPALAHAQLGLANAEGAPHTTSAFATKLPPVDGFEYVAEVTPVLLRGSQPDTGGVAWLKRRGVKTVVNLRRVHGDREQARVEAAGMRYVHIPLAASEPPEPGQITAFLRLLRDPSAGPVFVHCAQGVDRTGTMLAIYRMEVERWSNSRAYDEMMSFGAHRVWRDLRRFVRRYQRGQPGHVLRTNL
jgi:protein tyrosine/serine phosphatase